MAVEDLTVGEEKPDLVAIRAEGEALAQSDPVAVAARSKDDQDADLKASLADQIEGVLAEYAHPLLESQAPEYAAAYTAPRIRQISEAAAKVCIKRGWFKNGLDLFGSSSKWGAELALIIAVATPAVLVWWLKSQEVKAAQEGEVKR
jgi:hypothetical protein